MKALPGLPGVHAGVGSRLCKAAVAEHRWIPPPRGHGMVCFSSVLTLPKLRQLLCFLETVFSGPPGFVLLMSPS